ncbi:MAG TPA: TonB family protein [Longimicrobium sp.]|nr:TonB family protein [Longimicrobium sp.]
MTRRFIPSRTGRILPALGAALLLGATPANAQSRAEQLLSDRPPPRHSCTVATAPGRLPALSQLADSAALAGAVAEFAQRYPISGGQPMFGLYSIAFNAAGAVERVKDLEYFLPRDKSDEFTALVRQHLRAQGPGRGWSVRLRVEPAGTPVFRVGRSEVCEPESNTRFSVEAPALEGGRRPTPIRLRAHVNQDGVVDDVQLLRGSGSEELDRWVQDTLRRHRFEPGMVDGVAVPMNHEETVHLRSRG